MRRQGREAYSLPALSLVLFPFAEALRLRRRQVPDAVRGRGFDRAFEITSVQAGFDMCLSVLKKGGVLVQVGMPPKGDIVNVDINEIIFGERELLGVRHHTMSSMQIAAKLSAPAVLTSSCPR